MKAFISYSHKDSGLLDRLHTHLAQLKRDGQLSSWTDEQILAGSELNNDISKNLASSQIFIALLSPDYIASNYCYEQEFKKAMELEEKGELIIIPIVLEPCDWHNTPFKNFKALPKDGKPISEWSNINTAFLDIIQNIRKLLDNQGVQEPAVVNTGEKQPSATRNYRVKKDFDSIQKLEFIEQSFSEMKSYLSMYSKELLQVDDNIKCRDIKNTDDAYESILVNRNKIGAEATLQLKIIAKNSPNNRMSSFSGERDIQYSINTSNRSDRGFILAHDDYALFWTQDNNFYGKEKSKLTSKEMTDIIWDEWLESVGINI